MRYNQLDTQIRGDLISPLAQLKQDHHLQGMCWLDTTDWPVSSITMGVQMQPSLHRQGMAPSFQSAANSFTVLKSGISERLTLAALVFRHRLWPALPPLLRGGNDLQTSHASPIHTEQTPCTVSGPERRRGKALENSLRIVKRGLEAFAFHFS